ncbi:hypothetical protein MNBD_GAMMA22-860 [hydrothermal vent metagenome]|uniref:ABC transporter substrate-binding protein n=1 Tax=hydrothermal vent metagenome TaxID=652676 RepID=A0A3B1ATP8_9ZZZZ
MAYYHFTKFDHAIFFVLLITSVISNSYATQPKCLHIMSYHSGYAWNDGIEAGVEKTLAGKCTLKKFYMDTKRNKSKKFAKKMALKAKLLIESYQPDIVIASDDNASRYLVKTYYKNNKLPFVFCGINWTAESYGYPYDNVTGMVEVAPIIPLLNIIKKTVPKVTQGTYLSADVVTEHKDFNHYQQEYDKKNIKLQGVFVTSMAQWKKAYKQAQSSDFIILNNYAGINDWDAKQAIAHVQQYSRKFTVTNYKWMMPFAMFALTKNAFEQGRWSAEVALSVLSGTDISEIPITINKEWDIFVNVELLKRSNLKLNKHILRRASRRW